MAARQRGKTAAPPKAYHRLCSGAGWLTEHKRCSCEAGNFPPMVHYRMNHPHIH